MLISALGISHEGGGQIRNDNLNAHDPTIVLLTLLLAFLLRDLLIFPKLGSMLKAIRAPWRSLFKRLLPSAFKWTPSRLKIPTESHEMERCRTALPPLAITKDLILELYTFLLASICFCERALRLLTSQLGISEESYI